MIFYDCQCYELPPTHVFVAKVQLCANHLQHVVCHIAQRDSLTMYFDRDEITFTSLFFSIFILWLKSLNDEGREETKHLAGYLA